MKAAPNPCSARQTISTRGLGANAQSSDAATKTAMPEPNTRRKPKRSPAAPPIRISEAMSSM